MGLGALKDVSLAEARKKAAQERSEAAEGVDPVEARARSRALSRPSRRRRRATSARTVTGGENPKHARQWVSTLKTYARPFVGEKPVDQITTEDMLSTLSPIWTTCTETAKRVQGRMENILDFAAARQWRDPLNPARWRGHLDKLLPRPTRVKTVRRQPAMPYSELPGFMSELRSMDSISARALQFLILTATRTSEVLQAQWSEVDLQASVWTVPAARMKARQRA
jgi:integrase